MSVLHKTSFLSFQRGIYLRTILCGVTLDVMTDGKLGDFMIEEWYRWNAWSRRRMMESYDVWSIYLPGNVFLYV